MMEDLNLIESVDALWFFANVFSSSIAKPMSIVSDDHDEESRKSNTPKSDPSKPTTPILEIHQTHIPIDDIVVEESPKCGDFAAENGELKETEQQEEKRIKKKRRVKSDFDTRRRVVNWLDFGNEIDEFCMRMMMMDDDGKSTGCIYGNDGKIMGTMPSFSDEMAMREHLKSWAYSVACAVK
ncbi:hypothetical protein LguiB_033889 [Lonicera macranthoides]